VWGQAQGFREKIFQSFYDTKMSKWNKMAIQYHDIIIFLPLTATFSLQSQKERKKERRKERKKERKIMKGRKADRDP